ncbi:sugar phosphate isomerase/epimerase family protein [Paenibacillus xerothermodurans]|uniref:Sugar phosphate isomerase/epimerase n=1 Tax=Paenibacillus xerothermodurans TaxID=1977292 RepID=A0A2W1NDZ1_PAEXE|nr:sugar phosphate isomerase/epimerase [Paenibacillus xerothermodurans]PZE21341.1 sugar phosphate isomerase/epimerase [Paenibacillus xerothermodurans]
MKLSVFTVSTPDLTPEELAAAAKQAGIDGIEWRYKDTDPSVLGDPPSFWGNNICTIQPGLGDGQLDQFQRAAGEQGLSVISVTPYLSVNDVEGTEQVLSAAKKLGAAFIRLAVARYDGSTHFNDLYEQQIKYLKQVAPLCKQYGVKGLLETHHKTIAASASAAYRLCEHFDPDSIGVLYDPGNMVHEGFENYRMGMELLGPYLAHVHVKNAAWQSNGTTEDGSSAWSCGWTGINQGVVPWQQVIDDLKSVGYDGYLGVEDFSKQYASREMLQQFASYMRSLM